MLVDSETNLAIGDPAQAPFPAPEAIDFFLLQQNIEKRRRFGVASPSGIRQVFDATNGDDGTGFVDGQGTEITDAAKVYVATIADAFVDYLARQKAQGAAPLKIVLGMDTRPTGPALADIILRMLLARNVEVRYVFVAAVTKVVVYAREAADGFLYVSASHNPVGYNGLKVGLADGKTLPPETAYAFIKGYEARLADPENTREIIARLNEVPAHQVLAAIEGIRKHRAEANEMYHRFCDRLIAGATDPANVQEQKAFLREHIRALDLWIGLDPNGGARQDKAYLESWGFHVHEINARPRADMVHQLAPTLEATEAAQREMLRLQQEGKRVVAFFVFDTDGDRRNVVLPDGKGGVLLPGVQTIFALDILTAVGDRIERRLLTYDEHGATRDRVSIVVNGPTSALIDHLAERFGLILRRTETGEASVAKAGQLLAEEGVDVAMMGEGSNGSAFTLDLLVREPVHTIRTIISLISRPRLVKELAARLDGNICCDNWHRRDQIYYLIAHLIALLPSSATTDLFTANGERKGLPLPQDLFKANFDALFEEVWPCRRSELAEGIVDDPRKFSREYVTHEMTEERRGRGNRKTQTGGYKIEFFVETDDRRRLIGWIWFRVSGTEHGLIRRGASVAHWSNSRAMIDLVTRKQRQFDAFLGELLDEAERRTIKQIRSEFDPASEERRELEAAIGAMPEPERL